MGADELKKKCSACGADMDLVASSCIGKGLVSSSHRCTNKECNKIETIQYQLETKDDEGQWCSWL